MRVRLSNFRAGRRGNILMVALVVAGITGIALLSYLSLISNQNTMTLRSQSWNSALPLVEAGIEEAIAHITVSTNVAVGWATNGWSGSRWNVQRTRELGEGYYTVSVTNREVPVVTAYGYVRAPLSTGYISRAVQAVMIMKPDIGPGMAAKTTIDLNGNKLSVDSFDSSDLAYSDLTGMYSAARHKDGVTVASNGGFIDTVNVGNADIWGKVATGAGGTVDILKKGTVGSAAYHAASKNGIEAGASSSDADMPFPPIVAPVSGSSPTTIGSSVVLSNGVYEVGSLTGSLVVYGKATLIVRTTFSIGGKDTIILAPGATLDLYVYASKASFSAGDYNFTAGSRAANLKYYGMPSNTTLDFNGSVNFSGVVYAPDADLNYNGGGKSLNFVGASMSKTVKMNGTFDFHYDEALKKLAAPGYVISQWDEL